MCYPKPGPRCSAHAAERLLRAKHARLAYFSEHRGSLDWNEYEKLSEACDAAEAEYNITPAGIKSLERLVRDSGGYASYQMKLDAAVTERKSRLKALKASERVEAKHEVKALEPVKYKHSSFSSDGERLEAFKQSDEDVLTLIRESEAWVHHLDADEIDVLNWYSMGGYEEINGGLSNPNWVGRDMPNGEVKKGADAEIIALLDSAIAKADSSKSAIVYRRHFFYNEAGDFADHGLEWQQKQFQPGSVFKPGFYMSTSLNPENLPSSNGFVAGFEIRTSRGAALPAVASQGTNEMEILLPRDGEYRVVSNDKKVTVTNSHGEEHELVIIQLEEIV